MYSYVLFQFFLCRYVLVRTSTYCHAQNYQEYVPAHTISVHGGVYQYVPVRTAINGTYVYRIPGVDPGHPSPGSRTGLRLHQLRTGLRLHQVLRQEGTSVAGPLRPPDPHGAACTAQRAQGPVRLRPLPGSTASRHAPGVRRRLPRQRPPSSPAVSVTRPSSKPARAPPGPRPRPARACSGPAE
jgi:hypothetical protein